MVERAYAPGVRRGTWSRANVTRARIRRPATDPDKPVSDFWTPIARDEAFERRLLAEIERALEDAPGG